MIYEVGKRYQFVNNDGAVFEGTCTKVVDDPDKPGVCTVTFAQFPDEGANTYVALLDEPHVPAVYSRG